MKPPLDDLVKKFNCHPDILDGNQVSPYNLGRQLDLWSGLESPLGESMLAPGYQKSSLFEGSILEERLGIKKRQAEGQQ